MSKLFVMDQEKTLDALAKAASIDLEVGSVTLYAVVCVGSDEDPTFSHGGQLTLSAHDAIAATNLANDDDHRCHYLTAAVGIQPDELITIANMVLSEGWKEPGDLT